VTPDGEEIITAGKDGTARIWNRRTGEQRATLTGHTDPVVAVTPDGEGIITAGKDGTARIWNRRTGEQRAPPSPTRSRNHSPGAPSGGFAHLPAFVED
jgi:WD40 repeat protein